MNGIAANTVKSAKQLAIDAAKKAVREPAEILRTAGRQVSGVEARPQGPQKFSPPTGEGVAQNQPKVDAMKLKAQGERQLQALKAEIQQIRNTKLQEQMEKSQAEAQAAQMQVSRQSEALPQSASKPSRRLMGGLKAQVKKFSGMNKAEMRKPPSG